MSRRDDELLIQRIFDREVTETDFEQLEARLRDEPALRDLYRQYARLDHSLSEEFEGRAQIEEPFRTLRQSAARPITLGQSVLAAAALLVLFASVAWFIGVRPFGASTVVSYGPETSASVIHPDGRTNDGRLRNGSRLSLIRGTVQLRLPSGVRAVLEGPSTVECRGRNELRLEFGRAWFEVPPEAKGFICRTSDLVIEDLGTEFGVLADPGHHQEVHVLKGLVRVHPLGLPDQYRELRRDESIAWSGRFFTQATHAGNFATALPRPVPILREDFAASSQSGLARKKPRLGPGAWIRTEGSPILHDGLVDSVGSAMKAFLPLDTSRLNDDDNVLVVTIDTAEPDSRAFHSDGWAGLSLYADDEEVVFAGDPFGPGTRWSLDPPDGEIIPSEPPLRGAQAVTLRYDFRTGSLQMFGGHNSCGRVLASTMLSPGLRFDTLRIGNGEGGDIAVRSLRADILVSP